MSSLVGVMHGRCLRCVLVGGLTAYMRVLYRIEDLISVEPADRKMEDG